MVIVTKWSSSVDPFNFCILSALTGMGFSVLNGYRKDLDELKEQCQLHVAQADEYRKEIDKLQKHLLEANENTRRLEHLLSNMPNLPVTTPSQLLSDRPSHPHRNPQMLSPNKNHQADNPDLSGDGQVTEQMEMAINSANEALEEQQETINALVRERDLLIRERDIARQQADGAMQRVEEMRSKLNSPPPEQVPNHVKVVLEQQSETIQEQKQQIDLYLQVNQAAPKRTSRIMRAGGVDLKWAVSLLKVHRTVVSTSTCACSCFWLLCKKRPTSAAKLHWSS